MDSSDSMGNSETSNILNMKNDNGEATMTIQLEIPKEFVFDYRDRLEEFFGRVFGDVERTGVLCGRYEREIIEMMKKAFKESTVVNEVK